MGPKMLNLHPRSKDCFRFENQLNKDPSKWRFSSCCRLLCSSRHLQVISQPKNGKNGSNLSFFSKISAEICEPCFQDSECTPFIGYCRKPENGYHPYMGYRPPMPRAPHNMVDPVSFIIHHEADGYGADRMSPDKKVLQRLNINTKS